MQTQEIEKLRDWFLSQKRDLPWREKATPYAVWVSEVMLQQTQASVVIPYFMRWMERFPTVEALAKAPIEEVLKEWEGLGYYARARNLHQGARYIAEHCSGQIPSLAQELLKIKGLGPYTVGAILNFAFHQKAAAVDGNVLRVLTRYYGLSDDICKPKTVKKIQTLTHELLPDEEPWVISEALIELGATTCMRQPKCMECPLNGSCRAFLTGQSHLLPVKSTQTTITPLVRTVAVVMHSNHFLVKQGVKGKIMADLFEFPYFEMPHADVSFADQQACVIKGLNLDLQWQHELPKVKHSFTRYRALLLPHLYQSSSRKKIEGYEWLPLNAIKKLPFSSGHRRILNTL